MSHRDLRGVESPTTVHVIGLSVPVTAAASWWLAQLHARAAAAGSALGPRPGSWLLDGAAALPLVMVAVWGALVLAARVRRADGQGRLNALSLIALVAGSASLGVALAAPMTPMLTGGGAALQVLPVLSDTLVAMPVAALVAAATWLVGQVYLAGGRNTRLRVVPAAVAGVLMGAAVTGGALLSAPASASTPVSSGACPATAPVRSYDVQAININIPLNRFGDHDPKGKMYVLTSHIPAVRAEEATQKVSIGLRADPIQPLVIRANEGECLQLTYTNNADGGDFGVHVDGLAFDAASSGDAVGNNAASTVAKGKSASYTYFVPNDPTLEGAHYLHPGPGFRDFVNHGLFGSVVVEPPDSTYLDPNAIDEAHATALESGWEAIIRPGAANVCAAPSGTGSMPVRCPEFRENVQLYHEIGNEGDKDAVLNSKNVPLPFVDPHTDAYRPGTRAINYRSEPFFDRLGFAPLQEAHAYASYTFGDPATPMPRGYQADPTKFRILHAGSEMFHVFHMHGGGIRWRFNPVADPTYFYGDTGLNKHPLESSDSERLDSQAFGPGESYNLEIEGGAGGVQQGAGDFLFHCHIAEHYVAGMWSFWRVYDTRQSDFAPLADRTAPSWPVDSTQLIGKTINGQTITAANLASWITPQIPPKGARQNSTDGAVWNWGTNPANPNQYLGEPEDNTAYADDYNTQPGHPTALPDDTFVGNRPVLLFNPNNGRPAYPMMRPHLGMRPPFSPNGHSGAPYLGENGSAAPTAPITATHLDPYAGRKDGICAAKQADGTPTVTRRFNIVAIEHPVQITPVDTDPIGMVFALAHDKDAMLAGSKPIQPLALRTNVGECDAVTLTSELTDTNAADHYSQVNVHIHHVQFDTQASDGVISGMSYEQAVRPYKLEDPQLAADAAAGATALQLASVTKFQVGESIGVGLGTEGPAATGTANAGQSGMGPEIRTITAIDAATKTVSLSAPLTIAHPAGEYAGTEFTQYRWFPDVNLDNIFFHDHVDGIHTWAHGLVGQLITEPKGSTYHDPRTGAPADSGTIVDIHTNSAVAAAAGMTGSFREMALWTMDKGFGATADSTLNLRANPLTDRLGDPALKFSSYTHGDPLTPLPRAYAGDPFVIRTISVAPTVDTLHVDGHTFGYENRYADPAGGTEGAAVDTLHYGISEKYTLILKGGAGGTNHLPGDYLYFNGIDRRITDGAWGIIRVLPGRVTADPSDPNYLQPLPGTSPPDAPALPTVTGGVPPQPSGVPSPCPAGATPHAVNVTAVRVPGVDGSIKYAYVPSSQAAAVLNGSLTPEPLVLHVLANECVHVTVTNQTKEPKISFHLAGLAGDIASSGVDVGWNPDTSVADGTSRTYTYYVDNAKVSGDSIADMTGFDKNGLYGAYTVSPAGATIRNPITGAITDVGASVDVQPPGKPAYRDYTLVLSEDERQLGASFMPYPVNAEKPGSVRVNYRQAPRDDSKADAFSSAVNGDPSTPILSAYAGDPMRVHVLVAPGSEQTHAFNLGGLSFSLDPNIKYADSAETRGVGPWEMLTAQVSGGAGGTAHEPGDYFYGDMRRDFTEAGMWGLQRVLPTPATCPDPGAGLQCLPAHAPDAPVIGAASAGVRSVAVSWTAPVSTGGAPITGYTVTAVRADTGAQSSVAVAGDARSAVVGGLGNGVSYRVQVSASNAVGAGAASAWSNAVLTPNVPGAARIGTAHAGLSTDRTVISASIAWSAPLATGGSPVSGYRVTAFRFSGAHLVSSKVWATLAPSAHALNFTGLVAGGTYRFRVQALNAVGIGAASAYSNLVAAR